MNTITLYTDKLCVFSKQIKNDLRKAGLIYQEKLVDENMDAFVEMYNHTQNKVTPVILINSDNKANIFVGYSSENKKKIEELLQVKFN